MTNDIRIWEVDGSSKAAELVDAIGRAFARGGAGQEYGHANAGPDAGAVRRRSTVAFSICSAWTRTETRCVRVEARKLTRDAVAQAIDYCSYLESLTETELAAYIAHHLG